MALAARANTNGAAGVVASFQITLPTHSAGDLMVLAVAAQFDNTASIDQSWQKAGESYDATSFNYIGMFWKVAESGAETAPTVTFNGSAQYAWKAGTFYENSGSGLQYGLADSGAQENATSDTTAETPVLTASGNNNVSLLAVTNDNTGTSPTFTTPTNYTAMGVIRAFSTGLRRLHVFYRDGLTGTVDAGAITVSSAHKTATAHQVHAIQGGFAPGVLGGRPSARRR